MKQALEVLKGVEGISFSFFTARDVVRHPMVQRIVEAYGEAEAENGNDDAGSGRQS